MRSGTFLLQIPYLLIFLVSMSFTCIKILVQTYQNTFKTNEQILKKANLFGCPHYPTDLDHLEEKNYRVRELGPPCTFAKKWSKFSYKKSFVGQLKHTFWTKIVGKKKKSSYTQFIDPNNLVELA